MGTYLPVAIIAIIFFLYIFSQFGSRLLARQAFIWWIVSLFIITAILYPTFFQRFAVFLGVSLASNLIFAGLILLLMFLSIEQSAELAKLSKSMREIFTEEAAFLFLQKRIQPEPHQELPPRVLIILPCFNEEASVKNVCLLLKEQTEKAPIHLEYCLVNDASTDLTKQILGIYSPRHFTSHRVNMGVSAALLTGFKIAETLKWDYVVQCDTDGQHPVEEIPHLVEVAMDRYADLLIGSRFKESIFTSLKSTTFLRRLGSIFISQFLRLFKTKIPITDPTSGFRVYSRKAILYLLKNMPDEYPEPETIALLAWERMKIEEVKVQMNPRTSGTSSLRGLKGPLYMMKVVSALLGLRLRTLFAAYGFSRKV